MNKILSQNAEMTVAEPSAQPVPQGCPDTADQRWRIVVDKRSTRLLKIACGISLIFAAIVYGLHLGFDAPFIIPKEKTNVVIGVHWVAPLSLGLFAFGLITAWRALRGRNQALPGETMGYAAVVLAVIAVIVATTYLKFHVKLWIPILAADYYDELLYQTDLAVPSLINAMVELRQWIAQYLPHADLWYGLGFWLAFCLSFAHLSAVRNPYFHNTALGVLLIITVGVLSYLVMPSVGPFIFEPGVNAHSAEAQGLMLKAVDVFREGGVPMVELHGPAYFTAGLAAMPSLHVAHITLLFWYAAKAKSVMAPAIGLLLFWTVIEVVAAKWHYVIDIPVGFALAVGAIWLTDWLLDGKLPLRRSAQNPHL